MSDTSNAPQAAAPADAKRILITTAIALVVGALVVFGFVAPAEYGFDPLRTGRLFGLTALSNANAQDNFALYEGEGAAGIRTDSYEVEIAPFEWFEYKYELEEGAGIVFQWEASAPIKVEMHAHVVGSPDAEFFDVDTVQARKGTYIAEFTGEHGWYWINEGTENVTVRLTARGYISGAVEYAIGGGEARQTLDD